MLLALINPRIWPLEPLPLHNLDSNCAAIAALMSVESCSVFDGPHDTRWDYDAETENYQRTRGT